jgi:glyoxylase-like metal-dependent hydrolase (beta-lactamase superfamily II)/ferredoxin
VADLRKRLKLNAPGEFFVDSTCIDCDTCRQLAPDVFGDSGEYAFIQLQPNNKKQLCEAMRALLCCPTGSIGTEHSNDAVSVRSDFPLWLEDGIYYAGFNSPKSYGGNSYFIRHADGNWLIDSPKYLPYLVEQFEALGGLRFIFLTHRDDVGDAAKYARKFGAERIIHRKELSAQPEAERVLDGYEPIDVSSEFTVIPTPGHTAGHCVLLHRERFLFTGDHLAWDRDAGELQAFYGACWYSWEEQIKSMEKLQRFSFEWVLPGHGQRIKLRREEMAREVAELTKRMLKRS